MWQDWPKINHLTIDSVPKFKRMIGFRSGHTGLHSLWEGDVTDGDGGRRYSRLSEDHFVAADPDITWSSIDGDTAVWFGPVDGETTGRAVEGNGLADTSAPHSGDPVPSHWANMDYYGTCTEFPGSVSSPEQ